MNKFQQMFEDRGFDLEEDNNNDELCDELYDLYKLEVAKVKDLKGYIVDTYKYGVDRDSLERRVEQYKKELEIK